MQRELSKKEIQSIVSTWSIKLMKDIILKRFNKKCQSVVKECTFIYICDIIEVYYNNEFNYIKIYEFKR